MRFRFAQLFLLMEVVVSCSPGPVRPSDLAGVRYEIFVRSFADSNGDGIGDINGLTSKLDYLEDLGVKAVWLMPVMKSPSYHKYDVADYMSIDPEYGTTDDFHKLVTSLHDRGMQIIIDLAINHTSKEHPWFRQALEQPKSKYRSYYVWDQLDSVSKRIASKKVLTQSDNLSQWHRAEADFKGEHYYGCYSSFMPDLNYDNPEVRKEIIAIGKFWLEEMKVDGFRLDGARYIYEEERSADSHAFWVWFREEMEKIKPGVYLVGEVWGDTELAAPFVKGLHSVFNFDMSSDIRRVLKEGTDTIGLVGRYLAEDARYRSVSADYRDAIFLTNHDMDRVASELKNELEKARAAAGILLSLADVPYMYYGEELGMRGQKPDEMIREPFLWGSGLEEVMQTRWETPQYSTDVSVRPLTVQQNDPGSLYHFYRDLIRYRNHSEALAQGKVSPTAMQMRELVTFYKSTSKEKRCVLVNISDIEVTLKMEGEFAPFQTIDFDFSRKASFDKEGLRIPAYSTLILK